MILFFKYAARHQQFTWWTNDRERYKQETAQYLNLKTPMALKLGEGVIIAEAMTQKSVWHDYDKLTKSTHELVTFK